MRRRGEERCLGLLSLLLLLLLTRYSVHSFTHSLTHSLGSSGAAIGDTHKHTTQTRHKDMGGAWAREELRERAESRLLSPRAD